MQLTNLGLPALGIILLTTATTQATEIWNGPRFTFTKTAFVDPNDPTEQDRITDNVWLTRGESSGLFNIAKEDGYEFNKSPDDTAWAFGTTADIGSLIFRDWRSTTFSDGNMGPPNTTNLDMVVHLITDDIYIDIKFLTWGFRPDAGGLFSYERGTPVPEPATLGLALLSSLAMLGRRWQ